MQQHQHKLRSHKSPTGCLKVTTYQAWQHGAELGDLVPQFALLDTAAGGLLHLGQALLRGGQLRLQLRAPAHTALNPGETAQPVMLESLARGVLGMPGMQVSKSSEGPKRAAYENSLLGA